MRYKKVDTSKIKVEDRPGYIRAWRKTLDSDMFRQLTASQRDVWLVCLMLANHKPKKWEWEEQIIECQPGQFVTSLSKLNELTAVDTSVQNIRTALKKLEKWQFLTHQSTKTGSLITICNWSVYQHVDSENQQGNQQRANKELTTTKNIENIKNKRYNVETPDGDSNAPIDEIYFKAADYAIAVIQKNHPNLSLNGTIRKNAAEDFERLVRIDKKSLKDLRAILDWLPNAPEDPRSGFSWKQQIQSPRKFRRKDRDGVLYFDKLLIAMKQASGAHEESRYEQL